MSKIKKKIPLIAKSISFTQFSIVYDVKIDIIEEDWFLSPVYCADDISDKELILKPTIIQKNTTKKVVFTPSNVTPHFYQAIIEKKIQAYEEYKVELENIYKVGDVVGYIII